jgi:hypothetical protein
MMEWAAIFDVSTVVSAAAAVAAGVSAIAAVLAVYWQRRNGQLALSINLIQQLTTTFHGGEMRNHRRTAAKAIKEASANNLNRLREDEDDILAVLNFFDRLGTLLRVGAIEEYFVWSAFFWWVMMYWVGARLLLQKNDLKLYMSGLTFLHERLVAFDGEQKKRLGLSAEELTTEKLLGYLDGEQRI